MAKKLTKEERERNLASHRKMLLLEEQEYLFDILRGVHEEIMDMDYLIKVSVEKEQRLVSHGKVKRK